MIPLVATAASTREVAIDPTLLAVLSIFGGVALTAGAALLGAWIQSRREHDKWIREQRLAAFIASRVYVTNARSLIQKFRKTQAEAAAGDKAASARMADIHKESTALLASFAEASAPLTIVGPDDVNDAVRAVSKAITDNDQVAVDVADKLVVERMRTALRIANTHPGRESGGEHTWIQSPPSRRR
ncbi:hypothetical protein [Microbacterium sp. NPDC089695]|uniref:hypothetical protein n=1 Tax=Microbacterium sp. NPDC089695 TaxID=3364198 RepID=UPI00381E4982